MEDLTLPLAQPLVTSLADQRCSPCGAETSGGSCEAESVASLAASLGNDVNSSGPLGGVVHGLQPGGWLDSSATGACASRLAGGCIPRSVEAEWPLVVKKGSLNSSPIFVPLVLNFSANVVWWGGGRILLPGSWEWIRLSALAGMDLGCDG
jgi:hypothetical protein